MKTYIRSILGIIGLTVVIIIHELGHFLAALYYNVAVPIFSIGFGPALWQVPTRWTTFQIAVLPLGGYVELSPAALDAQSYGAKVIIMMAGIASNLVSAYLMLVLLAVRANGFTSFSLALQELKAIARGLRDVPGKFFSKEKPVIIGPFKIISMVGKSFEMGAYQGLYILVFLSINIALFNLLPLPFLDGGQLAWYTMQELTHYVGQRAAYLMVIVLMLISILRMISKSAQRNNPCN